MRRTIEVVDDDIYIAVIVEVAEYGASANALFQKRRSQLSCNLGKSAVVIVMVYQVALPIGRDLRVDVTVGYKQIGPAVVIIVEEFCSPTDIGKTNGRNFSCIGNVGEGIGPVVMIKSVVVVVEIGYEQIKPPIVIIVADRHPHASLFAAIFINCCSRCESDILERAVPIVVIEKIRH